MGRIYKDQSIEVLGLSDAHLYRLRNHGVVTVGQLQQMSEELLRHVPCGGTQHFGKGKVEVIQKALQAKGLPRLPKYRPR